jgi:hypothetical protein
MYAPDDQQFRVQPEVVAARITDIGRNIIYRAGTASRSRTYNPNVRSTMSYVTGSHAVKVGFDLMSGRYTRDDLTPFSTQYLALNGTPLQVIYRDAPSQYTTKLNPNMALFAQDQWTLKRMTVNGGVRFSLFRNGYKTQSQGPTPWVPVERNYPGRDVVVSWKDLVPRLGVAYDVFGTGTTAIKGNISKYVLQEGMERGRDIFPGAANIQDARRWTDLDGDRVVDGDPFNPAANIELGPRTNNNFGTATSPSLSYDPDWAFGFNNRPNQWEMSLSVQQQIVPGMSVNGGYFRRVYGNFNVTDNLAVTAADYDQFCITTPIDARLPGGGGQPVCGLYDLRANKVGQVNNLVTFAENYGDLSQKWHGMDLTVSARVARALFQGGLATGKAMVDTCGIVRGNPDINATVDVAGGTFLRGLGSGPLASTDFCKPDNPWQTQFKFLGSYTMPYDIQVAATFQSLNAPVLLANGTFTSAQIAPSLGRPLAAAASATINMVAPGTVLGDRMSQLDFRASKAFKFGRTQIKGMVDVYNILNNNAVAVRSSTYGATSGPTTGSAWLVPKSVLDARFAKFAVQVDF